MEHGQIIFRLFGPANKQVAKPVKPGMGALDHLTAGFLAGFFGLGFFAPWPNMGRVAECGDYFPHLGIIVARV